MKGWGPKKFGMSLETRETKLFWWDIPGFCWDIPGVPEKSEKKKFVFNFGPLFLVRQGPLGCWVTKHCTYLQGDAEWAGQLSSRRLS